MNNKNLNVPIKMGVAGYTTVTVIDKETGKIIYEHKDKPNLLVNGYFNAVLQSLSGPLFQWGPGGGNLISTGAVCYIGTGSNPAAKTDTTAVFTNAKTANAGTSAKSAEFANPIWKSFTFTFAAGVFVGNLYELGIANGSTLCARQVLSSPVNVSSNNEIIITWKIEAQVQQQTSGTITDGQRPYTTNWVSGTLYAINDKVRHNNRNWQSTIDNNSTEPANGNSDWTDVSDINWVLTINNRQMMTHFTRSTNPIIGYINPSPATSSTISPYSMPFSGSTVVITKFGSSNAATDLVNDSYYTLKGDLVAGGAGTNAALHQAAVYNTTTKTLSVRRGFEHTFFPDNTEIGELIICTSRDESTSLSIGALCRVTFTPKLDRATLYRLFIGYSISMSDVNNP